MEEESRAFGKEYESISPVKLDEKQKYDGMEVEETETVAFVKGEIQPPEYRDKYFALLFFAHLIAVLATAITFAPAALGNISKAEESPTQGTDDNISLTAAAVFAVVALLVSAGVTTGFLRLATHYSNQVVHFSFLVSPLSFTCVALIITFTGGSDVAIGFWVFAAFISLCMVLSFRIYRKFIPFAASTLKVALIAIQAQPGIYYMAFMFQLLMNAWSIFWVVTTIGVFYHADNARGKEPCTELGLDDDVKYPYGSMCDKGPNVFALVLLVLSLYWTHQVIQNVLHVTVAGAVGSWWFSPMNGYSICSTELMASLGRATTYSFGSICYGSLLVAILQTLEYIAKRARQNRGQSLLTCVISCVAECLVHCLREIIEYFNSWAFVYVALYGYGYYDAGKNVVSLFKQRGWTTFISDRLVFRVLLFFNLAVGGLCGALAVVAGAVSTSIWGDDAMGNNLVAMFFGGLVSGIILSGVMLFVVESTVRTIIVCFAESPNEFQEMHPELFAELQGGWSEAYPNEWMAASHPERIPEARVLA